MRHLKRSQCWRFRDGTENSAWKQRAAVYPSVDFFVERSPALSNGRRKYFPLVTRNIFAPKTGPTRFPRKALILSRLLAMQTARKQPTKWNFHFKALPASISALSLRLSPFASLPSCARFSFYRTFSFQGKDLSFISTAIHVYVYTAHTLLYTQLVACVIWHSFSVCLSVCLSVSLPLSLSLTATNLT